MKISYLPLLLLLLPAAGASAQNVFIQRDFWNTKPSIAIVQQKIAEGNNILEMGPGGWDGPLLAIMADCDFETVKYILDLPGIDVNVSTHHANNYLMWTTYKANLPVMQLLLSKGSKTDIINSHGQSLLMHAGMSGKADTALYEFCLRNGGDIVNDKDEEGRNVMLTAISRLEDISFLNYFVSKGLTLKDTDNKGNGLFHYAVPGGNIQTLKDLVKLGVTYAPNPAGENAFSFVGKGRGARVFIELLQYLADLGIDPKTPAANGQTLAHTVARAGAGKEVLQFLKDKGLQLAQTDEDGNTPLILAASRGNKESVLFWLEYNKVNAVNKEGISALGNAVAYNTPEVVNLLIEKGAKTGIKDKEGHNLYYTLIDAYSKDKKSLQRASDIADALKASKLDMPKNGSLLHVALDKDDQELMSKLVSWGENINAKDKDGYTVLHYAAMRSKDLELIRFLIEKGADPRIKTELNESVNDLITENEVLGKQDLNLDFLKK